MLMYGDAYMANNLLSTTNNLVVFNLSSLNERFPRLYLIPPNTLGVNSELQFDINYMNWIVYNDGPFSEFMKIITSINNGYNVYIVISKEDWSINLIESLTKYIQERYGITAVFVESYEDFIYANDSEAVEGPGLFNMQEDLARYSYTNYNTLKTQVSDEYNNSNWKSNGVQQTEPEYENYEW